MNEKQLCKIAWMDSCNMPSNIHLTDDGIETLCGNHSEYLANRVLSIVPKKANGRSQFCKICFKNGHKSAPWHEKCSGNA
jgi:hypothetical protein